MSDAKRLNQLEEENAKLKRIVAEQALDITMLKDLEKKWLARRRRERRQSFRLGDGVVTWITSTTPVKLRIEGRVCHSF